MQTRGEVIEEYAEAFKDGTEGNRLLETVNVISSLKCSDEDKSCCLREEIDHIICGYLNYREESK